jgi:CRISPR-associated protein Cmr5
MQTREQRYAAAVYKKMKAYQTETANDIQAYGSMAHQLPVLIRTAGLSQALAFLQSRPKSAQSKTLYNDLREAIQTVSTLDLDTHRDVPLDRYMRLSDEALAALLWFKRYAQSLYDIDGTQEARDESS